LNTCPCASGEVAITARKAEKSRILRTAGLLGAT
jgi:hypothetical protein